MEIILYLEPLNFTINDIDFNDKRERIGHKISSYTQKNSFPDLEGIDIAIIGVKEDRYSVNNFGCDKAPDTVRKKLYQLFPCNNTLRIADLGNIIRGNNVEDTYFALTEVLAFLIKNNILPIVIGGSQDLSFANYRAYEKIGQIINIASIDSRFDLGDTDNEISAQSYLSKIILHQPNYLFNYTNIGFQTYFVDLEAIDIMNKLYFDVYRLGFIKSDMEYVEPLLRNSDMVSIDISSVRQPDAPGNRNVSPNGFNGEEICRITRYAGLSDKISSIGFYEINPELDINEQTSHLTAQMIWYFIEGYYNRKHDFPYKEKKSYKKFYVSIKDNTHEIIFYKSKKSDRWWMEVPCPSSELKAKYERHYLVPCSYSDYQKALEDDVPERWWKVFKKLM